MNKYFVGSYYETAYILTFCCYSVAKPCPTLWDPRIHQASLFLPGFAQTHGPWVSDAINPVIFCHPILLLPSVFPIRVFSKETALHSRWPKYWSFSFSISPSNEHPGLISFRMDWMDLLAVQGTLTRLLQHHSSKASILRCAAFFIVQLSHPHMTTGKNHSFDYTSLCQQRSVSAF